MVQEILHFSHVHVVVFQQSKTSIPEHPSQLRLTSFLNQKVHKIHPKFSDQNIQSDLTEQKHIMGCSESKIHNVRTVNQCKERTAFMKQSVTAHAAFVSAHAAYAAALKNTGAALFNYARSELDDHPPPPHAPDHSLRPPLQRDGILAWDFFVMLMENAHGPSLAVVDDKHSAIEKPVMQRKVVKNLQEHGGGGVVKTANGGDGEAAESGKGPPLSSMNEDVNYVSLLKVFRELGDGFIKASESAYEVLKVHKANKLHYHSCFVGNQGQIKHPTRVTRVINSTKVDFSPKEKETHATLLDKMLAWEKKLYDQVKDGEMMKHEYQKKIRLLNKLRKRGLSSDRLKQTEITVNHLHTRYIVEMQSVDSTVAEINRLRDEQLYPKLVQIVEQMGEMWKNIRNQHEHQLTSVQRLINIKLSQSPIDTSENNLKNIEQIHLQATIWSSEFEKLTLHQKQYIKSLNNWLNLNLISTDHNVKPQNPRIEPLLRTWTDELEKLPEETAKTAINSFSTATAAIVEHHSTEMKMKERCDAIRREIKRRTLKFEEWCDKRIRKRLPSGEMDVDVMDDMDVVAEQQAVVEVLKRRLSEEEEVYRRCRVEVKEMTVMKMKTALTEAFMAMMEFSGACSQLYESLKTR